MSMPLQQTDCSKTIHAVYNRWYSLKKLRILSATSEMHLEIAHTARNGQAVGEDMHTVCNGWYLEKWLDRLQQAARSPTPLIHSCNKFGSELRNSLYCKNVSFFEARLFIRSRTFLSLKNIGNPNLLWVRILQRLSGNNGRYPENRYVRQMGSARVPVCRAGRPAAISSATGYVGSAAELSREDIKMKRGDKAVWKLPLFHYFVFAWFGNVFSALLCFLWSFRSACDIV